MVLCEREKWRCTVNCVVLEGEIREVGIYSVTGRSGDVQ